MFTDVISKCILQVRKRMSIFGAMMLFANIVESRKIDTAATDGINIFVNKDFY